MSDETQGAGSGAGAAKPNPWKEITQPFVDVWHAPRALWGVNLSYMLEGLAYFGVLGYLAIYFSEQVFAGVPNPDTYAHNMVAVLTGGITISMLFLGFVPDKVGVRRALIWSFILVLIGRVRWLEPVFGLDRLSRVHHWNGFALAALIVVHAPLMSAAYALLGGLVAVAVTDRLEDGLSAVYTFYDPALTDRGLGHHCILRQITHGLDLGLPYLYLGYWVEGSDKMGYKGQYRPLQALRGDRWVALA